MEKNTLLIAAGLALAGFAAYKYMSAPTPPPNAGPGATFIPPGGNVNGYLNTANAPVWVTATGVVLNGLGQIMQSIPWDNILNEDTSAASSGGGY